MSCLYYRTMESPVGRLLLVGTETTLHRIYFEEEMREGNLPERPSSDARPLEPHVRALESYFAGSLREFDLPLDPQGTVFQRRMWGFLRSIPYGSTISYGELAESIGKPRAARAVGYANSRNPIPILIPCRRVIGSDRSLTGYAGGLDRKQWLLKHEGAAFRCQGEPTDSPAGPIAEY